MEMEAVCHDGFFIWINEKAVCSAEGRWASLGLLLAKRGNKFSFRKKARARQRVRGRRKAAYGKRAHPIPFLVSAARGSNGGSRSAARDEAVTPPRKVTVQVRQSTCTQRGPKGERVTLRDLAPVVSLRVS